MLTRPQTALRQATTLLLVITITALAFTIPACEEFGSDVYQDWVSIYDGDTLDDDGGQALALDDEGNAYVTGYSWGNDTSIDYATMKYDSSGRRLWVARYDGPASDKDWALDLTLDKAGNVYVTGWSVGNNSKTDCATVKYSTEGDQLWCARYDGPVGGFDEAYGIATDYAGNVYVIGWSLGNGTNADCLTIKYDGDGNQVWAARYNGPEGGEDKSYTLVVDGWANVYVTGSSQGDGTEKDIVTLKYDTDGNQLWVARYNGPGDGDDQGRDMAVDNMGDIYVTGWSRGIDSAADYVTIQYSSSGDQQWVARYDGPAHEDDVAYDLALLPSGGVCITGASQGRDTGADYATVRYNRDGDELWVSRYNGPADAEDTARAVSLDAFGELYVSGWSRGGVEGRFDFATVKYDDAGKQLWVVRYDGPAGGHDKVYAMATDGTGSTFVTGRSSGEATYYDYTTIRYTPE
jgi:hypothetical protein